MDARTRITTIRDYIGQVLDYSDKMHRALAELNKHLAQLPVADAINSDELARREKALAERERELREKFAKVDALLGADA